MKTNLNILTFLLDSAHIQHKSSSDEKISRKHDKSLYCLYCNTLITSYRFLINVEGKQEHIFTNPGGYVFQITCFSAARGAMCHGVPTDFFSWFKGTAWNYALCGRCHTHLGWFFNKSTAETSFFGLIKEKLVEKTD